MILPRIARDRRRHVRVPSRRPVRLRCDATGRSLTGQTLDISDGGCLMRLDGLETLESGQAVRVGIAHRAHLGLVLTSQMLEGTVVRRLGHGEAQHVAVSFETSTVLAEAV